MTNYYLKSGKIYGPLNEDIMPPVNKEAPLYNSACIQFLQKLPLLPSYPLHPPGWLTGERVVGEGEFRLKQVCSICGQEDRCANYAQYRNTCDNVSMVAVPPEGKPSIVSEVFKQWQKETGTPTPARPSETEKGEEVCQKCGGYNPNWSAENDLFNKINGSPNGIICPICFAKEAVKKGIDIYFRGTAEIPAASLPDSRAVNVMSILNALWNDARRVKDDLPWQELNYACDKKTTVALAHAVLFSGQPVQPPQTKEQEKLWKEINRVLLDIGISQALRKVIIKRLMQSFHITPQKTTAND